MQTYDVKWDIAAALRVVCDTQLGTREYRHELKTWAARLHRKQEGYQPWGGAPKYWAGAYNMMLQKNDSIAGSVGFKGFRVDKFNYPGGLKDYKDHGYKPKPGDANVLWLVDLAAREAK